MYNLLNYLALVSSRATTILQEELYHNNVTTIENIDYNVQKEKDDVLKDNYQQQDHVPRRLALSNYVVDFEFLPVIQTPYRVTVELTGGDVFNVGNTAAFKWVTENDDCTVDVEDSLFSKTDPAIGVTRLRSSKLFTFTNGGRYKLCYASDGDFAVTGEALQPIKLVQGAVISNELPTAICKASTFVEGEQCTIEVVDLVGDGRAIWLPYKRINNCNADYTDVLDEDILKLVDPNGIQPNGNIFELPVPQVSQVFKDFFYTLCYCPRDCAGALHSYVQPIGYVKYIMGALTNKASPTLYNALSRGVPYGLKITCPENECPQQAKIKVALETCINDPIPLCDYPRNAFNVEGVSKNNPCDQLYVQVPNTLFIDTILDFEGPFRLPLDTEVKSFIEEIPIFLCIEINSAWRHIETFSVINWEFSDISPDGSMRPLSVAGAEETLTMVSEKPIELTMLGFNGCVHLTKEHCSEGKVTDLFEMKMFSITEDAYTVTFGGDKELGLPSMIPANPGVYNLCYCVNPLCQCTSEWWTKLNTFTISGPQIQNLPVIQTMTPGRLFEVRGYGIVPGDELRFINTFSGCDSNRGNPDPVLTCPLDVTCDTASIGDIVLRSSTWTRDDEDKNDLGIDDFGVITSVDCPETKNAAVLWANDFEAPYFIGQENIFELTPTSWTLCAVEGEMCECFSTVRFGVVTFTYQKVTHKQGLIQCIGTNFGFTAEEEFSGSPVCYCYVKPATWRNDYCNLNKMPTDLAVRTMNSQIQDCITDITTGAQTCSDKPLITAIEVLSATQTKITFASPPVWATVLGPKGLREGDVLFMHRLYLACAQDAISDGRCADNDLDSLRGVIRLKGLLCYYSFEDHFDSIGSHTPLPYDWDLDVALGKKGKKSLLLLINTYIAISSLWQLRISQSWSICFWYKFKSYGPHIFFGFSNMDGISDPSEFIVGVQTDKMLYVHQKGVYEEITPVVDDVMITRNMWQHLCVVHNHRTHQLFFYNDDVIHLQIDDIELTDVTPYTTHNIFGLGGQHDLAIVQQSYLQIDELRIWNIPLTWDEALLVREEEVNIGLVESFGSGQKVLSVDESTAIIDIGWEDTANHGPGKLFTIQQPQPTDGVNWEITNRAMTYPEVVSVLPVDIKVCWRRARQSYVEPAMAQTSFIPPNQFSELYYVPTSPIQDTIQPMVVRFTVPRGLKEIYSEQEITIQLIFLDTSILSIRPPYAVSTTEQLFSAGKDITYGENGMTEENVALDPLNLVIPCGSLWTEVHSTGVGFPIARNCTQQAIGDSRVIRLGFSVGAFEVGQSYSLVFLGVLGDNYRDGTRVGTLSSLLWTGETVETGTLDASVNSVKVRQSDDNILKSFRLITQYYKEEDKKIEIDITEDETARFKRSSTLEIFPQPIFAWEFPQACEATCLAIDEAEDSEKRDCGPVFCRVVPKFPKGAALMMQFVVIRINFVPQEQGRFRFILSFINSRALYVKPFHMIKWYAQIIPDEDDEANSDEVIGYSFQSSINPTEDPINYNTEGFESTVMNYISYGAAAGIWKDGGLLTSFVDDVTTARLRIIFINVLKEGMELIIQGPKGLEMIEPFALEVDTFAETLTPPTLWDVPNTLQWSIGTGDTSNQMILSFIAPHQIFQGQIATFGIKFKNPSTPLAITDAANVWSITLDIKQSFLLPTSAHTGGLFTESFNILGKLQGFFCPEFLGLSTINNRVQISFTTVTKVPTLTVYIHIRLIGLLAYQLPEGITEIPQVVTSRKLIILENRIPLDKSRRLIELAVVGPLNVETYDLTIIDLTNDEISGNPLYIELTTVNDLGALVDRGELSAPTDALSLFVNDPPRFTIQSIPNPISIDSFETSSLIPQNENTLTIRLTDLDTLHLPLSIVGPFMIDPDNSGATLFEWLPTNTHDVAIEKWDVVNNNVQIPLPNPLPTELLLTIPFQFPHPQARNLGGWIVVNQLGHIRIIPAPVQVLELQKWKTSTSLGAHAVHEITMTFQADTSLVLVDLPHDMDCISIQAATPVTCKIEREEVQQGNYTVEFFTARFEGTFQSKDTITFPLEGINPTFEEQLLLADESDENAIRDEWVIHTYTDNVPTTRSHAPITLPFEEGVWPMVGVSIEAHDRHPDVRQAVDIEFTLLEGTPSPATSAKELTILAPAGFRFDYPCRSSIFAEPHDVPQYDVHLKVSGCVREQDNMIIIELEDAIPVPTVQNATYGFQLMVTNARFIPPDAYSTWSLSTVLGAAIVPGYPLQTFAYVFLNPSSKAASPICFTYEECVGDNNLARARVTVGITLEPLSYIPIGGHISIRVPPNFIVSPIRCEVYPEDDVQWFHDDIICGTSYYYTKPNVIDIIEEDVYHDTFSLMLLKVPMEIGSRYTISFDVYHPRSSNEQPSGWWHIESFNTTTGDLFAEEEVASSTTTTPIPAFLTKPPDQAPLEQDEEIVEKDKSAEAERLEQTRLALINQLDANKPITRSIVEHATETAAKTTLSRNKNHISKGEDDLLLDRATVIGYTLFPTLQYELEKENPIARGGHIDMITIQFIMPTNVVKDTELIFWGPVDYPFACSSFTWFPFDTITRSYELWSISCRDTTLVFSVLQLNGETLMQTGDLFKFAIGVTNPKANKGRSGDEAIAFQWRLSISRKSTGLITMGSKSAWRVVTQFTYARTLLLGPVFGAHNLHIVELQFVASSPSTDITIRTLDFATTPQTLALYRTNGPYQKASMVPSASPHEIVLFFNIDIGKLYTITLDPLRSLRHGPSHWQIQAQWRGQESDERTFTGFHTPSRLEPRLRFIPNEGGSLATFTYGRSFQEVTAILHIRSTMYPEEISKLWIRPQLTVEKTWNETVQGEYNIQGFSFTGNVTINAGTIECEIINMIDGLELLMNTLQVDPEESLLLALTQEKAARTALLAGETLAPDHISNIPGIAPLQIEFGLILSDTYASEWEISMWKKDTIVWEEEDGPIFDPRKDLPLGTNDGLLKGPRVIATIPVNVDIENPAPDILWQVTFLLEPVRMEYLSEGTLGYRVHVPNNFIPIPDCLEDVSYGQMYTATCNKKYIYVGCPVVLEGQSQFCDSPVNITLNIMSPHVVPEKNEWIVEHVGLAMPLGWGVIEGFDITSMNATVHYGKISSTDSQVEIKIQPRMFISENTTIVIQAPIDTELICQIYSVDIFVSNCQLLDFVTERSQTQLDVRQHWEILDDTHFLAPALRMEIENDMEAGEWYTFMITSRTPAVIRNFEWDIYLENLDGIKVESAIQVVDEDTDVIYGLNVQFLPVLWDEEEDSVDVQWEVLQRIFAEITIEVQSPRDLLECYCTYPEVQWGNCTIDPEDPQFAQVTITEGYQIPSGAYGLHLIHDGELRDLNIYRVKFLTDKLETTFPIAGPNTDEKSPKGLFKLINPRPMDHTTTYGHTLSWILSLFHIL